MLKEIKNANKSRWAHKSHPLRNFEVAFFYFFEPVYIGSAVRMEPSLSLILHSFFIELHTTF